MANFLHKPINADGQNAVKIARRIRKKTEIKKNKLELLLGKQLNGTTDFPRIDLQSINDFPILRKKKIIRKIFFGTYQFKQSKSYACEVYKNSVAFILDSRSIKKNFENTSNGSKVIAFLIKSRHSRSEGNPKNYKVFIQYIPFLNKTKAIEGISLSCYSVFYLLFIYN